MRASTHGNRAACGDQPAREGITAGDLQPRPDLLHSGEHVPDGGVGESRLHRACDTARRSVGRASALTRGGDAGKRRAREELERQLKVASAQERATLAPQYDDGADNTNRIVIERSADTSFVMDNASTALAAIPGLRPDSVDTSAAHLVGFSLGGAVATVTAERDPRARSVANLDGGLYGSRNAREIRVPYLMMYSAANRRQQRWAPAWSCAARGSRWHHSSELSRRGRVAAGLALLACHRLDERRDVRGPAKLDRSGIPFRGNVLKL